MWPVEEADDGEDPPVPDFTATEARFGAHTYEPLGVLLSRDEGVWAWDAQGMRYLDCLTAYSAVNQGHCRPKSWPLWWNRSAADIDLPGLPQRPTGPFYEQIVELTGSCKVLPMNSGAEAVESAIKSVRKWGYEVRLILLRAANLALQRAGSRCAFAACTF